VGAQGCERFKSILGSKSMASTVTGRVPREPAQATGAGRRASSRRDGSCPKASYRAFIRNASGWSARQRGLQLRTIGVRF
jgi:hypothetical protein